MPCATADFHPVDNRLKSLRRPPAGSNLAVSHPAYDARISCERGGAMKSLSRYAIEKPISLALVMVVALAMLP
ncbi:MAG: hypothetical protein ACTHLC_00315, partial [Rhizobiaceae bacterium]